MLRGFDCLQRGGSFIKDPNVDHKCWERPEDMDTVRTVYWVSPSSPGSNVAGETAAALAAASMVFRKVDHKYSKLLIRTAKKVFQFAIQYKGSYSDSLGSAVCPFYYSYSGYKDELLWRAAWLLRATNVVYYFNFLKSMGGDSPDIFSWDNKFAGAYVLLSRRSVLNKDKKFNSYKQQAEQFMCRILPNSPSSSTEYTKGGLMFKLPQSNRQYVASITFLLSTYSKYMSATKHTFNCGNLVVTSRTLRTVCNSSFKERQRLWDHLASNTDLHIQPQDSYMGDANKRKSMSGNETGENDSHHLSSAPAFKEKLLQRMLIIKEFLNTPDRRICKEVNAMGRFGAL